MRPVPIKYDTIQIRRVCETRKHNGTVCEIALRTAMIRLSISPGPGAVSKHFALSQRKMAAGGAELNQNLSVVGKMKVFDKNGGQIDFEDLYRDRKAIIVFVRVRAYAIAPHS